MFYPDRYYGLILLSNGILALLISIFIAARGLKNLQNRLMGLSLAGFSFYLTFESLIYIAQSQNELWVNRLRNLSLAGVMLASYSLFLGGILIAKGPRYIQDHRKFFIGFTLFHGLIAILSFITESIGFSTTDPVVMEFRGSIISIILSHGYPVIIIAIGLYYFYVIYQDAKRDERIAKKILTLIIGITVIVLGALWMASIRTIFLDQIAPALIYLPGHLFYFLGSILMFFTFRK